MNILIILLSIFIIGLLIAIHELGHLAFAKMFDVYCFEYAIGFGPKIFQKKGKETVFTLRALPIGGFVSMYGETEDLPEEYEKLEIPKERSLLHVAKWKRVLIMSGGILMNFVVAFLLFVIGNTIPYSQISTKVATSENAVLVSEGHILIPDRTYDHIEANYNILSEVEIAGESYYAAIYIHDFNDLSIENYLEFIPTSNLNVTNLDDLYEPKEEMTISLPLTFAESYDQETQSYVNEYTVTFPLQIVYDDSAGKYKYEGLNFTLTKNVYRRSFSEVIVDSGKDWGHSSLAVGRALVTLFSPETFKNVGGVVAIFQQSTNIFTNYGWGQYIYIWGLISVNLALFNLLPFPGLDGWHLLVIIIEGVTRKEVPKKFKNIATAVGMILLLGLILFITVRDIVGLF